MKIGAILTLAATNGKEADSSESGKDAARKRRRFLSNTPDVKLDVLGKSLVDRTIERVAGSRSRRFDDDSRGPGWYPGIADALTTFE